MWDLDYKESWAAKNWCFWTVVLEKTLESPLDYQEIQLVYPQGDQSRIFIRRTDVEAETWILWPPNVKNDSLEKRPWCWERLKVGGEGDVRGWDGWMVSLTRWTWICKLWELVIDREAWRAAVHGVTKNWTWLSDWTELNWMYIYICHICIYIFAIYVLIYPRDLAFFHTEDEEGNKQGVVLQDVCIFHSQFQDLEKTYLASVYGLLRLSW